VGLQQIDKPRTFREEGEFGKKKRKKKNTPSEPREKALSNIGREGLKIPNNGLYGGEKSHVQISSENINMKHVSTKKKGDGESHKRKY